MSDSFTDVTSISWFTRIKNALIGILVGILLLVGAVAGIFWNEHRAVQTARSLAQGRGLVVEADAATPDPGNEGKLVHVAGQASVTQPLQDADWGVSAKGLRLRRVAEMYQWKEHSHTETTKHVGGGETETTTYTYDKTWSEDHINSSRFHHQQDHANPPKTIASRDLYAQDAMLGGFALGRDLLSQLPTGERFTVPQDLASGLKAKNADARIADGAIYIGPDPAAPRIGDVRLSYELTSVGPLSVIAAQSGAGFAPFQAPAGDKLDMIRPGTFTADQMFKQAEQENVAITWLLRAALLFAIWLGAFLLLRPVAVLADIIPFFGSLVGFGLGFVALVAAFVIGPVAIALAWFAFRPVAAIAVLAGGVLLAVAVHMLRRRAAPALPGPVAATPAR